MASMKYHTPVLVEPPASLPLGFHKPSPPVAAMERSAVAACGSAAFAAGEGSHRTAWPQFEVFAYRYAPSPPTHPHPRGCTQVTSAVTAVFPATAATGQYHRGCHAVRFPHVDPSATRTMPVRTEGGRAHVSSLPHPLHARPLTSSRAPLASASHIHPVLDHHTHH